MKLAILWLMLLLTPGIDFLLVFKNSLENKLNGIITGLGITFGIIFYEIIIVLFISIIPKIIIFILSFIGGIYLIYLAIQNLKSKQKIDKNIKKSGFIEGFLTNIFNPKVSILLYSFLSISNNIIQDSIIIAITTFLGWSFVAIISFYINKHFNSFLKYTHYIVSIVLFILGVWMLYDSIKILI